MLRESKALNLHRRFILRLLLQYFDFQMDLKLVLALAQLQALLADKLQQQPLAGLLLLVPEPLQWVLAFFFCQFQEFFLLKFSWLSIIFWQTSLRKLSEFSASRWQRKLEMQLPTS